MTELRSSLDLNSDATEIHVTPGTYTFSPCGGVDSTACHIAMPTRGVSIICDQDLGTGPCVLDGANMTRIFYIGTASPSTATYTFEGLTFWNGNVSCFSCFVGSLTMVMPTHPRSMHFGQANNGAAIHHYQGCLVVNNCFFLHNRAMLVSVYFCHLKTLLKHITSSSQCVFAISYSLINRAVVPTTNTTMEKLLLRAASLIVTLSKAQMRM